MLTFDEDTHTYWWETVPNPWYCPNCKIHFAEIETVDTGVGIRLCKSCDRSILKYRGHKIKIPSVTEIMKATGISKGFRGIDPYVLDRARRRGTAVHEITEILDRGLEPDMSMVDADIYDDVCNMVDAWEKYKDDHPVTIVGIEEPVSYIDKDGLGCPLYAGTVDRIMKLLGCHYIVDIKTSYSLSEDVSIQLALYALAIQRQREPEGVFSMEAIRLDKKGKYHRWSINTVNDEWERVARIAEDMIYRYHNWEIHKNKRGMKRV
jgi:hypothetical protein